MAGPCREGQGRTHAMTTHVVGALGYRIWLAGSNGWQRRNRKSVAMIGRRQAAWSLHLGLCSGTGLPFFFLGSHLMPLGGPWGCAPPRWEPAKDGKPMPPHRPSRHGRTTRCLPITIADFLFHRRQPLLPVNQMWHPDVPPT